jgi:hypothetical protein
VGWGCKITQDMFNRSRNLTFENKLQIQCLQEGESHRQFKNYLSVFFEINRREAGRKNEIKPVPEGQKDRPQPLERTQGRSSRLLRIPLQGMKRGWATGSEAGEIFYRFPVSLNRMVEPPDESRTWPSNRRLWCSANPVS